jgi:hypothetical protein
LKLYKKEGSVLQILSFPNDDIEKGDYLLIEDSKAGKALIVQVIDIQFANIPGILEELLRSCSDNSNLNGADFDPLDITPHITYIQDSRLLICKIRASIYNNRLNPSKGWLPSRSHSVIRKLSTQCLLEIIQAKGELPIVLGKTKDSSPLMVDASSLDGKLNIITGKKETGKSHLSKLLVLSLIHYGATVIIFDLNGEYAGLGYDSDGARNGYYDQIHVLTPGENFKLMLDQLDLRVMLNILVHALHLPGTSAREFRHIWKNLRERKALSLRALGETIRNWRCNIHIRDALFSRYYALVNSGLFTDNPSEASSIEQYLFKTREKGGAVIVNLRDTSPVDRQIIVEYTLGKLVELLSSWRLKAVFLFAEEAHLYLRETYWDDIVTRMRHFGIFTTFITNQPDSIRSSIYRQADNIFLFNFTNENDLEAVSRAARTDAETVKSIAGDLPPHHCLVLGKVVKDFPIVVKIRKLNVKTMGGTRLFFKGKTRKVNPEQMRV